MKVHFAMMTFYVVKVICDSLNIRHAEELSLMKSPFDREGYVKSTGYHRAKVKKQTRDGSPFDETDSSTPPGNYILVCSVHTLYMYCTCIHANIYMFVHECNYMYMYTCTVCNYEYT